MIYVFLGKDFNIVKNKIDNLISRLNISNITRYDDPGIDFDEVLDEVNYVDLFNEKKLVVVSNFSFKSLSEKTEKRFIKYIDNMSDDVIIIRCIDETIDERKSLTKALKSKCKVEKIESLDYKNLHEYVNNMFVDAGIYVDFNKIKRILDLCEYDPDYTISEVEKLLLYKIGETELTDKDIDEVISKNNEKEMYTFVENVIKKDIKGSLNSYKILNSSKIDETVLIEMLARQFRLLGYIKKLKISMDVNEIEKQLGVRNYIINRLIPYTNLYSDDEILDVLYKLSDCDIDIKVNGKDGSYVLENFIMTYTLR